MGGTKLAWTGGFRNTGYLAVTLGWGHLCSPGLLCCIGLLLCIFRKTPFQREEDLGALLGKSGAAAEVPDGTPESLRRVLGGSAAAAFDTVFGLSMAGVVSEVSHNVTGSGSEGALKMKETLGGGGARL